MLPTLMRKKNGNSPLVFFKLRQGAGKTSQHALGKNLWWGGPWGGKRKGVRWGLGGGGGGELNQNPYRTLRCSGRDARCVSCKIDRFPFHTWSPFAGDRSFLCPDL